jgi:two-component system, NtrC family, response regulator HydG
MSGQADSGGDETLTVERTSQARKHQAFELEVQKGPDSGRVFKIDPGDPEQPPRLLLGTSPACHLRLTDRTVSRRHAALESDGLQLRLTDLESTNGTRVSGLDAVEVLLSGGETIELGQSALLLRALGTPHASTPTSQSFGRMLGQSEEMQRLFLVCQKLAMSSVPVLIEGETGTGKELLAESIHELGPRAGGPFVVFDCAAIALGRAETLLFGQEVGALDAHSPRTAGVFEEAHGGTLLIDEVGELELPVQAKLLRVLERGEVRPLGSARTLKLDVRLLFTTRRDLDREVQAGRFRDDLFFRIAVARVEVPPLRRRGGDVEHLLRHFWRELGGDLQHVDARLLRSLSAYAWPGNVRELKSTVAQRLALGDLAPAPQQPSPSHAAGARDWLDQLLDRRLPLPQARREVLDVFLSRYVERVLAEHGGNVSKAAAASGLARRYFQILRARQR